MSNTHLFSLIDIPHGIHGTHKKFSHETQIISVVFYIKFRTLLDSIARSAIAYETD